MPKRKLDTLPYKGVRDFYPEDMFLRNYLFGKMCQTAESFGYTEYEASILEPAELYLAKTGEEIVNEQTYTFKDRGGRDVTLRPEMTPTVARMVAARRKELPLPIRWYSIPNLFRYERPQKGRLREHFQLNVDLFGDSSQEADKEIIKIAAKLLLNLGAKENDFEIKINDRQITNSLFEKFKLSEEQKYKVSKVIDKKAKISKENFKSALELIFKEKTEDFISILESNKKLVEILGEENPIIKKLMIFIDALAADGIKNVRFEQTLVRGFDYYSGFIFEIFDSDPENRRSLFGGGRYDDLLQIFGKEKLPAVGFGAGDVTISDFLETHNLIPEYESSVDLYLCALDGFETESDKLAQKLREDRINVAVDYMGRKIADQIKSAVKQKIPFFLCVGENEIKSGRYKVKNLKTEEEKELKEEEIIEFLNKQNAINNSV